MFFDVLVYKKPTKKEKEDDEKREELLFYSGATPLQGKDQQSVGFLAMADLLQQKPELRDDIDRIEVLIRPFA